MITHWPRCDGKATLNIADLQELARWHYIIALGFRYCTGYETDAAYHQELSAIYYAKARALYERLPT